MNYGKLSEKYLLLDTNILINYLKYRAFFEPVFKQIEENNITLVLDKFVEIEFLRGAQTQREAGDLKEFLEVFFQDNPPFPVNEDILQTAVDITHLYNWKLQNHKIEMVDCILAGVMEFYNRSKQQLFLMTINYKDFPKLFFDRVGIETIDTGDSILNLCIYGFNSTQYATLRSSFARED